jgi:hypothetical protein
MAQGLALPLHRETQTPKTRDARLRKNRVPAPPLNRHAFAKPLKYDQRFRMSF